MSSCRRSSPLLLYTIYEHALKPTVIREYSLTLEYQLSNTASFDIGYVGESGQHLVTAGAANQLKAPCLVGGVVVTTPTTTPSCAITDPAPFINLVGQGGSVVFTGSNAMMNYNALQATFRQRVHRGLEFTLNYAYGRAMTNSTGFYGVNGVAAQSPYADNFYNNHAEYGPSGQDIRHNLNGHATYELPVGRGRTYGANMNASLTRRLEDGRQPSQRSPTLVFP